MVKLKCILRKLCPKSTSTVRLRGRKKCLEDFSLAMSGITDLLTVKFKAWKIKLVRKRCHVT
jgi:hypothetical protein